MTAPDRSDIAAAPPESSPDPSADSGEMIARLRTAGAARFDPVRWRYVEALAGRAVAQQGRAKFMLEARLMQTLTAMADSLDLARRDAAEFVAQSAARYPHAAGDLQRCLDAGDFRELRRLVATLKNGEAGASLSALVRQFEPAAAGHADARMMESAGSRPELKAIRKFRNTWSKLSVDKQVTQALEQAPKNAGPINSHMLMLRSLTLMRDISPDYLNRFMSYADALLCLDEGENARLGSPKKPAGTRAKK